MVNLAYKPLFVAQAIEIYRWEEDNKRLDDNYAVSKVKIEALRQDMNEFMDRPTLLKSLGIEVEESSYSNLSNN